MTAVFYEKSKQVPSLDNDFNIHNFVENVTALSFRSRPIFQRPVSDAILWSRHSFFLSQSF